MDFPFWLQSRLTAHGFPVGMIDGDIGPVTIKAITAFQRAKGLQETGTANPLTIAALRTSSSAVPGAPWRDPVPPGIARSSEWPRQKDCMAFYGPVGTGQVQIDIPFDMALAWDKGTRLRKMTLHKRVAESATRVLQMIAGQYNEAERADLGINLFGGSLNVRKMRGGDSYSMHSWGIAIDFDPERNRLDWGGNRARLAHADALPFWRAWEAEGWLSLGRARNFDWMHIQAARL